MKITSHPLYSTWNTLRQRCHNPKNPEYPSYGGRGVEMCPEWRASFAQFAADVGPRPLGFILTRRDRSLPYTPQNTIWTCRKGMPFGLTRRRFLHQGEMLTLKQIVGLCGFDYNVVYSRLCTHGWTVERTIRTPVRRRRTALELSLLNPEDKQYGKNVKQPVQMGRFQVYYEK